MKNKTKEAIIQILSGLAVTMAFASMFVYGIMR